MTASLAYRKNEAAIIRGDVPVKYLRILPHIPGDRVLEIGSAEGVLSLLLARADMGGKAQVTALEKSQERHRAAIDLYHDWFQLFKFSARPVFECGQIQDHLHLLDGIDTLVAVRMIYYLGDAIDEVFAEVARKVPNVVLCGNRNRADRYRAGNPDEPLGEMNLYASIEGMVGLLRRHGYRIVSEVEEGDEIVVGRKDG